MHRLLLTMRAVAAPIAISTLLLAQATVTIETASPGGRVRPMSTSQKSLAATADGSRWTLVFNDDGQGTAASRQLVLKQSVDGGTTWTVAASVPTQENSLGSVVAGVGCNELHVAWSALDGASYYSAYYQKFDGATLQWVGTPQILIQGQGSNDQYYSRDVEVTPEGTVVVAVGSHRSPTSVTAGAWACLLMVEPAGTTGFQGPFQANTDSSGIAPNLLAEGEVVHASFRTANGGYGIRYRAFDTSTMTFVQGSDVPLDGANQGQMNASNTNTIAMEADGGLYVLYARGGSSAGTGELRLAYAAPGNTTNWTTQSVAMDPDLILGNVTYQHYALAQVGTNSVFVLYSKRTGEQHQNLYGRFYSGGVALAPEVLMLSGSAADEFAIVTALCSSNTVSDALVVYGDNSNSVSLARFNGTGRAVDFGVACVPAQGPTPTLHSLSVPTTGSTLNLEVQDCTPMGAGILFIGNRCNLPPVPLGQYGLTGCNLYHDIAGSQLFTTDASGVGSIPISIPAGASFTGAPIYVGALPLIPGANNIGAVTTNSLMIWIN